MKMEMEKGVTFWSSVKEIFHEYNSEITNLKENGAQLVTSAYRIGEDSTTNGKTSHRTREGGCKTQNDSNS